MASLFDRTMKHTLILISCLLAHFIGVAQNYHAINGSSYAGVLGVDNNPASLLNSDRAFDINILSFQTKYTTNAVTILNYSLISSPANSVYRINGKDFSRYANINVNLHLLNARIALSKTRSLAFGANLKSYSYATTSKYNFSDTIKHLRDFLVINDQNPVMSASLRSSSWIEYFATYSQTLWDREADRLHAGFTFRLNKGISGAFANIKDGVATKKSQPNRTFYVLNNGSADYAYSSNYDNWKKDRAASENLTNFLSQASTGFSFDLGIEYLVKNQAVPRYYDDDNYYNYEWKFGASLLDVGQVIYTAGANSRSLSRPRSDISDTELNNKFVQIAGNDAFNDSLGTIFNSVRVLSGNFSVINPARLVLNVDRPLGNHVFVNGELSLNLSSVPGRERFHVSELNLFSLTPRWETSRWGAYLPMLYNMRNQFWVGGAVKAGPLLLGFHNWANVFSNKKMNNGGGYIAFVFTPGTKIGIRKDRRFACPQ